MRADAPPRPLAISHGEPEAYRPCPHWIRLGSGDEISLLYPAEVRELRAVIDRYLSRCDQAKPEQVKGDAR